LDHQFDQHRERLERIVQLRLDRRLRSRVGVSDVVQEAHLEAWLRWEDYLRDPDRMPIFFWLRFLTAQKVLELHRRHMNAQRRDVRREVPMDHALPHPSSAPPAKRLLCGRGAPSIAAARSELRSRLLGALDTLSPDDREVLVLRHFEQLTHAEAAKELRVSEPAARKRYIRALERFRRVLANSPGSLWKSLHDRAG
jgi:RNA polymerase sigma-70 factor (ECF subfamily)